MIHIEFKGPKNFILFGSLMEPTKLHYFCLVAISVGHAHASDGHTFAQAISSESMSLSSSGNSVEKNSDSIVISTPKPRERIVPPTTQTSPVIQIHVRPLTPQPITPIQPPVSDLPVIP